MICERCSTPLMPVYSPQAGWRSACVKCGILRDGQPVQGRERAGELAERGLNCFALQDFDEAQKFFAQAARLDGNRPAYLWAMLLAEYGIRYCETRGAQYTINFWKMNLPARLFTAQPEYRKLCRGAASERATLGYYQQEAEEIERGMQQVRQMERENYDVFLCFKDLDKNGPTPEHRLCDGLYHELHNRKLKVFYAPRTLSGKYVMDFEAYIHGALRSAKLLVVVASSAENVASPWVESEWRRFQRWHQSDGRRLMTCVVGDMSATQFPKELQRYQCELYAKKDQLEDPLTLEAIAARIERGCRGVAPRKRNWKAAVAAVAAVAVLAVGGALAWRFLPRPSGNDPAPKALPVIAEPATEAPITEAPPTEGPITEAPPTEAPVTEAPTATPFPAPPLMCEDAGISNTDRVLGSRYQRGSISSIRFEDSLAGAPGDAWDASEAGDGSVLAWVEPNGNWVEPNGNLYDLTIVGNGGVVLPTDGKTLFAYYDHAEEIDFNGCVDASNMTSMGSMFYNCDSLQSLDLSGLDTSNVTDMSGMFSLCHSLQSLDLSGFDTSNVTDMRMMFSDCNSLQSLDLSDFDTSNVTDMFNMFSGCASLQSLDLSGFDTSNVTDMRWMFNRCANLQSLDLSGFDTSNVTNMGYMFYDCNSLQSLDLSGFDTSNVFVMSCMFYNCEKLIDLRISSGFVIHSDTGTSYMFDNCPLDMSDL